MKTVTLRYIMKPGTKDRFLEEIYSLDIPAKTRAEEGNISYEFYSSCDKDEIILIEKWKDQDALSEHVKMPHLIKLREIKDEYGVVTEKLDI